jgi:di/tricarboxylate transporter
VTSDIAIAAAITAGVLILLTTTSIGTEIVLLAAMVLLSVTGVLTPGEALAGFANPGVLTIGALYVVVAGLTETGTIAWLSQVMLRRPRNLRSALLRLLPTCGVVSSVMNNTPVVAMFIPIAQQWSTRYGISVSKLLLPMNNVAILGGLCTLIGTSTNLVVNGMLQQARPESALQLFDLVWVGVPLTILGVVYAVLFADRLLPSRAAPLEQLHSAREYSVQVRVEPNGPLVGRALGEVGLRGLRSAYVIEIQREQRLLTPVAPEEVLQAGDTLTCVGVVDAVKDLRRIPGLTVLNDQTFRLDLKNWQRQLIEIVLSSHSPLIGKTVKQANFRTQYQAAIISISREGDRVAGKVGDVELKPGDTLLVEAVPGFVEKHRYSREFLLVSAVQDSQPADFRKAPIAVAILIGMIGAEMLGVISLFEACFVAAGLMIATGCISSKIARQSIEYPIVAAIAASFALGVALMKSGAADALAAQLMLLVKNEPMLALAAVYVMTVIVTEIITNNAAGVLMFPIALAVADAAAVNHLPFVIAVMVAASAGFITPLGYQTNLMVYGAGGYHFRDFVRYGVPLSILVAIASLLIIPRVWPF